MFESLYMFSLTFFILDGMFLYAFLGLIGILALVTMEHERPGLCTFVVAAGLVILEFYSTSVRPLTFALNHPMDAAMIVAAYFVIGSIWIIIKWFSHVYKVRDRFNEVKDDCLKKMRDSVASYRKTGVDSVSSLSYFNEDGTLSEEGSSLFYRMAAGRISERVLPLQVSDHKAEMYTWWLCWPLSMFWTLLSDPITRLWHFVYNLFGGWMQTISNRAFEIK